MTKTAIALSGLTCCRVSISKNHEKSYVAYQILSDPTHVLRPLLLRRYENVGNRLKHGKQEGLCVDVSSNTLGRAHKRVVKVWTKRRFEAALFTQLRERGFGKRSRKIVGPASHPVTVGSAKPPVVVNDLRGTLSVQLVDTMVNIKGDEVYRQAGTIVDEVIRRCGISNATRGPRLGTG